jgi:tetratricopeptide (TPR) repeat protein
MAANQHANGHLWITGATAADRAALVPAGVAVTAATHRALRGPYTGVDTVLRALLPETYRRWPDLVESNRVELLYGTPELAELIGPAPDTLADTAPFQQRTRFYGATMIRCMSQGVVTFLIALAARRAQAGEAVLRLAFTGVDEAEVSTQELLALLLRRSDPATMAITVDSRGVPAHAELAAALQRYAAHVEAPPTPPAAERRTEAELAAAYVASDTTSDVAAERAAYDALPAADRAALHDRRADELAPGADRGTKVGALALHRELGSDPGGAGRRALIEAQRLCVAAGFSAMVVDLGLRGRAVTDAAAHPNDYRDFTMDAANSMIPSGRLAEAEQLYRELRRCSVDPKTHMITSYAIAMLFTRFRAPRDHETALEWQNNAIALAGLLPDERDRLVYSCFQHNALALIEMHRGNLERGLELIDAGIASLDVVLGDDEWVLHRSQLLYNRARLLSALRRYDEANRDFSTLIELDPYYTDYLCERARIARKRGDFAAALADYDRAVELAPPFPELYYTRGTARVEVGDVDGALADFGYVLDMEPDDVDTRLARAETLLALGDLDAAEADALAGLALRPSEPRLLCMLGSVAVERADWPAAIALLDEALGADPRYPAALVNRAVARYQLGEPSLAVADLTAALAVAGDDPDLLLNRGLAHAAAGSVDAALADWAAALELPDADEAELHYERARCLVAAGRADTAGPDLDACRRLGRPVEEIERLLAEAV